jgi:multisubunit Na+/H+ antiporter MnhB subunit
MSDESSFLSVGVVFAIVLLLFYILIAHLIEEKKVDFLHESGVAILMGALAGLIAFTVI